MKERVPLDGWWPMPIISPAWLAGCGSHPWGTKISTILWIYCSAVVALAIWPDKKDKSYVCPSKVPFCIWIIPNVLFYIFI